MIAQAASKSLINTSVIEANYKVILRWYMVQTRLATYVLGASPKCFRGCGQDGTIYHIWWQCPKVQRFWIRVYNFIFILTQINLIKFPKHALLGLKVDAASKNQRRLLTFIFISAIPFDQLKHKLSWLMINERLE